MDKKFTLHNGNCLDVLKEYPDNYFDSIVTDPPYGLSFMCSKWDYDVPSQEIWEECLRVLKPGGHLLAFAGTRTQHRMAVRIEDAGFEIRDMIAWTYSTGFPKSLNISKELDKKAGAEREVIGNNPNYHSEGKRSGSGVSQHGTKDGSFSNPESASLITAPATDEAKQWDGWGTALKPALEPITVARKPLIGTVIENVLVHGTGGINIDGCRVNSDQIRPNIIGGNNDRKFSGDFKQGSSQDGYTNMGRWPANLIHDGSDEVVDLFPDSNGSGKSRILKRSAKPDQEGWGMNVNAPDEFEMRDAGSGSAARFFYCAKASTKEKNQGLPEGESNIHPTVKPASLMSYLCRLVTPPNGIVLDPFMGSGSTGKAAMLEGFNFVGIEMTEDYMKIAEARISHAANNNPIEKNPSKKSEKKPTAMQQENLDVGGLDVEI